MSGFSPVRFELLSRAGVPHAVSTRIGGVSAGIFESLNFGNPSELPVERRDPASNIRENYRRLIESAACAGRELVEVHQVHGAVVHVVRRGVAGATPVPHGGEKKDVKADAMVTDDPSRALAIRVADCAPVLMASADGSIVGIAHAGWRGVVAGVVPACVEAMRELVPSMSPQGGRHRWHEIVAAIGPCIGPESFEVGPEVVAEFRRVFGGEAPVRGGDGDRSFVDLKAAIAVQLRRAGAVAVDISPHCTVRDADLFFSHRRERGLTGRMAAVISCR